MLISYQVGKDKSHLPFDPQKSHTTPLDPSALGENWKGWSMMCAEWSQIMPWYPWFFWMRLYWNSTIDTPFLYHMIFQQNIQQMIPWLSWNIPFYIIISYSHAIPMISHWYPIILSPLYQPISHWSLDPGPPMGPPWAARRPHGRRLPHPRRAAHVWTGGTWPSTNETCIMMINVPSGYLT